jgi:hypothetical protein
VNFKITNGDDKTDEDRRSIEESTMGLKLERGPLEKMVNGAFLGKRKMGRPVKYNIRTKGRQGWIELLFNPRSQFEV